jgi:hypothetical protein
MARKSTDLLDVFRAEKRVAESGPARPSPKAPREKRSFEGLLLLPRQLLLGGSVLVLLLVFAFVLGLSVGRRGAEGDAAALSAQIRRDAAPTKRAWFVVGRVPLVDPVRQAANEPLRLYGDLVHAKGVSADRIWIQDDPTRQHLQVLLGPFTDKRQATDFLMRANLLVARLGGVSAFQSPEYRQLGPDELPPTRLPTR